MRADGPAFGPGQKAVLLPGDRSLGLRAGQAAVELLAQRAPGAKEQRLDRRDRELEHGGDLRVRAALELAHDERRALTERKVAEGALDVRGRRCVLVGNEPFGEVLVEADLGGPA